MNRKGYSTTEQQAAASKRYAEKHPERIVANNRGQHQRLRSELFQRYGTSCNCCGEDNRIFLTIDHKIPPIDRKNRPGAGWMRDLRKSGFPPGYQTLCYNCNNAKAFGGPFCPHVIADWT